MTNKIDEYGAMAAQTVQWQDSFVALSDGSEAAPGKDSHECRCPNQDWDWDKAVSCWTHGREVSPKWASHTSGGSPKVSAVGDAANHLVRAAGPLRRSAIVVHPTEYRLIQ